MRVKNVLSLCMVSGLTILALAASVNASCSMIANMPEENLMSAECQTIPGQQDRNIEYISSKGDISSLESFTTEETYLLAKIAMAEAEGEDTEGKALVMLTVLNRTKDDKFPDSIRGVIFQPGQFSPIGNGRFNEVEPDPDCWAALDLIMLDKWDESCGATYFESKSESTWHADNLSFLFKHGKHYFYEERMDEISDEGIYETSD